MRLVHQATGIEVRLGDPVVSFRGEHASVIGWVQPKHAGSSGRIRVIGAAGRGEFYPSVFGCEWVDREDRPRDCERCGERLPVGRSCDCFDNGCQ